MKLLLWQAPRHKVGKKSPLKVKDKLRAPIVILLRISTLFSLDRRQKSSLFLSENTFCAPRAQSTEGISNYVLTLDPHLDKYITSRLDTRKEVFLKIPCELIPKCISIFPTYYLHSYRQINLVHMMLWGLRFSRRRVSRWLSSVCCTAQSGRYCPTFQTS
jgi:hypothetical protein